MAIHRLGSLDYRNLQFNKGIWNVNTSRIGDLVNNFFPEVKSVTSLSENKAFKWFFGVVAVEGEGEVQVVYPYTDSSRDVLLLRNVDFSSFPYIYLKAVPQEGWEFEGWYDSVDPKKNLSLQPSLTLTEETYPDVTGFLARFVHNEDRLGI